MSQYLEVLMQKEPQNRGQNPLFRLIVTQTVSNYYEDYLHI